MLLNLEGNSGTPLAVQWLRPCPHCRHTSLIPGQGTKVLHAASWAPLVAQLVKNPPAMWETWARSLGWEDSPGEGNGYPLQYSGLENSMDWIVHGVEKSWTPLNNFHFQFHASWYGQKKKKLKQTKL